MVLIGEWRHGCPVVIDMMDAGGLEDGPVLGNQERGVSHFDRVAIVSRQTLQEMIELSEEGVRINPGSLELKHERAGVLGEGLGIGREDLFVEVVGIE